MSDYYTMYPVVGDCQHSGLGNLSEPIETLRIEFHYDEDGRECGSMLTFQGQTHAENWYGEPYPSRSILFHQHSRGTGLLRASEGLSKPEGNEGRESRGIHPQDSQTLRQEPIGNGRPRRLKFPLHVYVIVIAIACAVAAFIQLIAEVAR